MNPKTLSPFPCYSCGKCCSNLHLSEETKSLDRGDGFCLYLNLKNKQCSIYDERPDICRVELQYRKNYASNYTWNEFVEINLSICEKLPDRFKMNNT
ncbi:YkgJ family cysteine cluster protein [Vibrio owensii]|uniref:YkgJ family cysteine cluster protein n=1 Tax=Vibrio TaxID=662 RepID=UPI0009FB71CA